MVARNPVALRRRRIRRRRWWRIAITVGLLLLPVLLALAGVSAYLSHHGKKTPMQWLGDRVADLVVPPDIFFDGRDRVNILVVGADKDYDRKGRPLPQPARSDTIIVVCLSYDGNAVVLSIPRDIVVRFNGKLHKINSAHAIGGPELLRQILAEQFGIEIHHFVQITFDAFIKLVDLVGGVDLFVEHDMHYDDNWGKLHIHLQRGQHHLDGEKAIGYVRYRGIGYRRYCPKCKVKIEHRDPTGDLGRMKRQQEFLKALAKKLLQPKMVTKLPRLASIANEYLVTDMSTRKILSLANFARQLSLEGIKTAMLPGDCAHHHRLGSIFIPDNEKTLQVLTELLGSTFFPYQWEQGEGSIRTALRVTARPARSRQTPTSEAVHEDADDTAQLEGVPIGDEPIEVTPTEPPKTPVPPPPEPPKPEEWKKPPPEPSPSSDQPSPQPVPTNPEGSKQQG